jgi:hypothetical protein
VLSDWHVPRASKWSQRIVWQRLAAVFWQECPHEWQREPCIELIC